MIEVINYKNMQDFYDSCGNISISKNKTSLYISVVDNIGFLNNKKTHNSISIAKRKINKAIKNKGKMVFLDKEIDNFFDYCALRTYPYSFVSSITNLQELFDQNKEFRICRNYARHFTESLYHYGIKRLFGSVASYCFFTTFSPAAIYNEFKESPMKPFGSPKEGFCIGALNFEYIKSKAMFKLSIIYRSAYLTHIYPNMYALSCLVSDILTDKKEIKINKICMEMFIPKLTINRRIFID